MGPGLIETARYIARAISEHLSDTSTYCRLTLSEAKTFAINLKKKITKWIRTNKDFLTAQERKFLRFHLRTNKQPFPAFYLLFKIHKNPYTTRPIVSCSGSLLYGIAAWVQRKIQVVVLQQRSYTRNSAQIKDEILREPVTCRT